MNTLADVMWYIDGNHVTLSSRSCAVPDSFAHFQGYNTPEKRKRKRISAENLKQAELLAYSGTLFELATNSFMKSDAWKCLYNAILRLATNLRKYADFLKKSSVNMAIHHNNILKGADETDRVQLLRSTAVIKPTFQARYKQLHTAIAHADKYEVICANDYSPVEPTKKYSFFKELQVPVKCVLFTYTGAREHLSFIWKVPLEGDEAPEYLERNNKNIAEIKKNLPHYHTRAMRREFVHSFGQVTNSKPALLREAYRRLTGDRSAASSLTEAEVDARVAEMLELEDPDLICDLRVNNAGRPQEYIVFLEKCQQYIERQVETAVDDRRHDPTTSDGDVVTHLATAMNTRHLYDSVVKDCGDGIPTPSIQWLRLQFWPRRCNSLSATRQKGTLRIKFMVQARQFRKSHVDVHYASSLFRYQKEFAVKFREYCSYISCDDKHTIKVGEPGFPVASAERGKQVLVDMNTKFQVGDHDFTKFKLIPSVHLDIAIPEDIQGSFYRGKVHVGLKDSCFESSSGLRHMTELRQIMEHSDTIKPMLLMYTDGGPDHRTTYLSVQIPLIAYFLDKDLDFLCAVRTPPYHSWKNPAERIMSILNCALQSVGLMRTSTDKEELLKKCGNTTEIRKLAEDNVSVKESIQDSLQAPMSMLGGLIMNLKLKEDQFSIFQASKSDDMENLWANILKIDPTMTRQCTTKKSIEKKQLFNKFLETHCRIRHYMFSIKKCGKDSCTICKAPRLPAELFNEIHHLPDPEPSRPDHYKPFDDVYGQKTSEKHRPSLVQRNQSNHGMPFSPSAQCAKNVGIVVQCQDCDKWRCLYSKKKISRKLHGKVESALEDLSYTCGSVFSDLEDEEMRGVFDSVFVKASLDCSQPTEKPWYAAGFEDICFFCGVEDDLNTNPESYPLCEECKKTRKPEKRSSRKKFKKT